MPLETRYVPELGRQVSRLGIGALPMGPLQLGLSVAEGARVIREAVENGISFIDTAVVYGTHAHVAAGLEGFTGEVTVATKTPARRDRQLAEQHIEASLRELRREPIDVILCHCARSPFTEEEWGPTVEALVAARERGLVRMIGVSSHSVQGVRQAAAHPEVKAIHPLINMTGMGITDGTADEMLAAIAEAHEAGKFVYAMKALAGGNLVSRREEALKFVYGQNAVDCVALGMVSVAEVQWNVRFASGLEVPAELSNAAAVTSKRLQILAMVCTGCGECVASCEHDALEVVEGKARVDRDRCVLCGYCAPACPHFAVRVV